MIESCGPGFQRLIGKNRESANSFRKLNFPLSYGEIHLGLLLITHRQKCETIKVLSCLLSRESWRKRNVNYFIAVGLNSERQFSISVHIFRRDIIRDKIWSGQVPP